MANTEIVILDYGLGNIFNLHRALHTIGGNCVISSDPEKIAKADKLVLPGVGAFETGMVNLKSGGKLEALLECRNRGADILGICLGMQLFLSHSEENGCHEGLNFIEGKVVRFQSADPGAKKIKIPQISWNNLEIPPGKPVDHWRKGILKGLADPVFMYFVHSYCVQLNNPADSLSMTSYGVDMFSSAIVKNNVIGCQFHPERSGEQGLLILKNFIDI